MLAVLSTQLAMRRIGTVARSDVSLSLIAVAQEDESPTGGEVKFIWATVHHPIPEVRGQVVHRLCVADEGVEGQDQEVHGQAKDTGIVLFPCAKGS